MASNEKFEWVIVEGTAACDTHVILYEGTKNGAIRKTMKRSRNVDDFVEHVTLYRLDRSEDPINGDRAAKPTKVVKLK